MTSWEWSRLGTTSAQTRHRGDASNRSTSRSHIRTKCEPCKHGVHESETAAMQASSAEAHSDWGEFSMARSNSGRRAWAILALDTSENDSYSNTASSVTRRGGPAEPTSSPDPTSRVSSSGTRTSPLTSAYALNVITCATTSHNVIYQPRQRQCPTMVRSDSIKYFLDHLFNCGRVKTLNFIRLQSY